MMARKTMHALKIPIFATSSLIAIGVGENAHAVDAVKRAKCITCTRRFCNLTIKIKID